MLPKSYVLTGSMLHPLFNVLQMILIPLLRIDAKNLHQGCESNASKIHGYMQDYESETFSVAGIRRTYSSFLHDLRGRASEK